MALGFSILVWTVQKIMFHICTQPHMIFPSMTWCVCVCVCVCVSRTVWQSTPVFLPGEFHGQKNLAGYSPWGSQSRTHLSD